MNIISISGSGVTTLVTFNSFGDPLPELEKRSLRGRSKRCERKLHSYSSLYLWYLQFWFLIFINGRILSLNLLEIKSINKK